MFDFCGLELQYFNPEDVPRVRKWYRTPGRGILARASPFASFSERFDNQIMGHEVFRQEGAGPISLQEFLSSREQRLY